MSTFTASSNGIGQLASGSLIQHKESVYTQEQLETYLAKIQYPKYQHLVDLSSPDAPLQRLHLLARLHLVTFPFSNADMHYTEDHVVDITPQGIYQKLVVDGNRGSYCYGQNTLMQNMLRLMGYRVQTITGYVPYPDEKDALPAWSHMTNLVQPFENSGTTYLMDVGWGANGLCRPILLSDDPKNIVQGTTPTERHRLIKKVHYQSVSRTPFWHLQVTHNPDAPELKWETNYAFFETEAFPADLISHNYSMCLLPTYHGLLRTNVLAVKYSFVDPEDPLGSDLGKTLLFGTVLKRSLGAKSELIRTFKEGEDKERILALRGVFGIYVGEEGERCIKDTFAHL